MRRKDSFLAGMDLRARAALIAYRAEAFDNVDVDGILAAPALSPERIGWIGRDLALNARSAAGFEAGRDLLRGVAEADFTRLPLAGNAEMASQGARHSSACPSLLIVAPVAFSPRTALGPCTSRTIAPRKVRTSCSVRPMR